MVPTKTANSVYNILNGCSINPMLINALLIIPFLPKILIQAKLRTTEFVNNGKIEIAINKPFHFVEQREIK